MAHTTTMESGIAAAFDCSTVCQENIQHCLTKGGRHAQADHIGLLLDCAEICALTGTAMARGSGTHTELARVCASVCDSCARSCDGFGDDRDMQRCAEACRRCADSCRQMAGMAATGG